GLLNMALLLNTPGVVVGQAVLFALFGFVTSPATGNVGSGTATLAGALPYVSLKIGAATKPFACGPAGKLAGLEAKSTVKLLVFNQPAPFCPTTVTVVEGNGIFSTGIKVEFVCLGVLPEMGSPAP